MPKRNYKCIKPCVYMGWTLLEGTLVAAREHPGDFFVLLDENDPERFYRAQVNEKPRHYDMWEPLKGEV